MQSAESSEIHRLIKRAVLRAQVGYRKPSAEQHVFTPNRLQRKFNPSAPKKAWETDITYIKTHEGWLYLGAVMKLVFASHYWLANGLSDHKRTCVRCVIYSGMAPET